MARGDLTDQEWERLAPLLPPQSRKGGKQPLPHRPLVNGILWRARTGAPWRDIPERYGKWNTIHSRFRRWVQAGIWTRVLQELQGRAEPGEEVEWCVVSIDSTTVRAHQHAAGAPHAPEEKGGPRACSGSARVPGTQSRRVDDQAAFGQRRTRSPVGAPPQRRAAAR